MSREIFSINSTFFEGIKILALVGNILMLYFPNVILPEGVEFPLLFKLIAIPILLFQFFSLPTNSVKVKEDRVIVFVTLFFLRVKTIELKFIDIRNIEFINKRYRNLLIRTRLKVKYKIPLFDLTHEHKKHLQYLHSNTSIEVILPN